MENSFSFCSLLQDHSQYQITCVALRVLSVALWCHVCHFTSFAALFSPITHDKMPWNVGAGFDSVIRLLYSPTILWRIAYLCLCWHGPRYGRSCNHSRLSYFVGAFPYFVGAFPSSLIMLFDFFSRSSDARTGSSLSVTKFTGLVRGGLFYRWPFSIFGLVLNV